MSEEKGKEEGKIASANDKLLAAACEAYGVAPKYVIGSSVKDGVATIVTYGGKKVRFKAGDKPEPLDQISVTGVNPAPKRKPITGPANK